MSNNSERSKQWRNKRKNDPLFVENERKRKQLSRKSRTEEQKKRDRELCRARQHRYRNRKRKLLLETIEDSVEEQMSDNSDDYRSISRGEAMETDSVGSVTRSQDLVILECDVNRSSSTKSESSEMSRCLLISVEDEQFAGLKASDTSGPVVIPDHEYHIVDNGDHSNNTDVLTTITGNSRNLLYDGFTLVIPASGKLKCDTETISRQDVINETGVNSLTLPTKTSNNVSQNETETKLSVEVRSGSETGIDINGNMADNTEQPYACPSELLTDTVINVNESVPTEEISTGSERPVLLSKSNTHSSTIEKKTTKWIQQYTEGENHEVKSFLTNDVTSTAVPQRQAFFTRLQNELSQITDFGDLKSRCGELYREIQEIYPMPAVSTLSNYGHQRDTIAESLYPPDAPNDHVPVHIVGDGNCLPRVGSLFAFGHDRHHIEIRVRIFIELCLFEDTYLNDSYLNRGLDNANMNKRTSALIAQYSDVFPRDTQGQDRYKYIYRVNTRNVLKAGSYNGMWSLFALASVIGVTVMSIYPDYGGHNVRDDHNRMVLPRVSRNTDTIIHIMWTNTEGRQLLASVWTPNHFVAVLHESKVNNISLGMAAGSSAGKNCLTSVTFTRASDEKRNEDSCIGHASEKPVYLCRTCNGHPICYKCLLEQHKNHEYEDLKLHIDKKENEYLLKTLQKHVSVLGTEIKRQQLENKRNIDRIAVEIDARVSLISEKLQKWRQQCRQRLQEDGKAIHNNIALSGTHVWTTHIPNNIRNLQKRLRNLHTTERLARLSEGPPEVTLTLDPCACIQFTSGNDDQLIKQFGGLSCILSDARDSISDSINTPGDVYDSSVINSVDKFRQSGLLINPSHHMTHTPETHNKDGATTSLGLSSCSASSVANQTDQKQSPDTQIQGDLNTPTLNKQPCTMPIVVNVESGRKRADLSSGASDINDKVPIISAPEDREKKTDIRNTNLSTNPSVMTKTRSVPNTADNTEIIKLLKGPNMAVSTNSAPPCAEKSLNPPSIKPSGMALPVRHFSIEVTPCSEVGSSCRQQMYISPVSSESSVYQTSVKSTAYLIQKSQMLGTKQTVCTVKNTAQNVCNEEDATQSVYIGEDTTQTVCTGEDTTQTITSINPTTMQRMNNTSDSEPTLKYKNMVNGHE